MKLFYAPTSAYVRKVSVVAFETGLNERLDIIFDPAKVFEPSAVLLEHNPLGKIPTLVLDDGQSLFDSTVICEYLDAHAVTAHVFPPIGPKRWEALTQQSLADGMLDAAMLARQERLLRAPNEQSEAWVAAQMGKIEAALQRFDAMCDAFDAAPTIGTITLGCALGFLDFRFGDSAWRDRYPRLAAWFNDFDQRPSMIATRPKVAV